jgi:hypothetical protein
MNHRLGVQTGSAGGEQLNDAAAETRSTSRRRHDQRARHCKPLDFLTDACNRAGGEHHALRRHIVGEGRTHARSIKG